MLRSRGGPLAQVIEDSREYFWLRPPARDDVKSKAYRDRHHQSKCYLL